MNPRTLAMSLGLSLLSAACDRPPVVRNCDFDAEVPCPNLNDPAGRIEGTLIYEGPSPPREVLGEQGSTINPRRDRALGRVVLLLFSADNPPPPTGTATTAASFQTISAAQLFHDATQVRPGIVRATIQYSFPGILQGGVYQIRAFYSRDEEVVATALSGPQPGTIVRAPSGFHPLFSVRNLPVKDDVGGGAVVDESAAIPAFQRIPIGVATGTDTDGHTRYHIPDEGFVAQNVNVFIGLPFPTERPQFQVVTRETHVMDPTGHDVTLPGPNRMTLLQAGPTPGIAEGHADAVAAGHEAPSQSQELLAHAYDTGLLPAGSAILEMRRNLIIEHSDSGEDVPSFSVRAGLPDQGDDRTASECDIATLAGVRCTRDPFHDIGFYESALDLDENGTIDLTEPSRWADAHPTLITTSPLAGATNGRLPWVYPLVIFSKLHEPTPAEAELLRSAAGGRLDPATYARLRTALNRAEGLDPANGRYPVLMFGSVVPGGTAANLLLRPWSRGYRAVEPFLRVAVIPIAVEIHGPDRHRDWVPIIPPGRPDLIHLASRFLEGPPARCCFEEPEWVEQQTGIPEGRYAINLIAAGGQAWTIPNELAEFAPTNSATTICGGGGTVCRAPSQATIIRVRDYERVSRTDLICPPEPLSYCPHWGD